MIRASLLGLVALTLTAQAPSAGTKADAPKPVDPVVARVGGKVVRQSELDAAMAALPAQQQQQLMMVEGAREKYVQQYLEMALLAAKAQRDGLDRTEAFQLKVDSARSQLLATELLHRDGPALQERMKLTEEDLKAYYEGNKAKFMTTGKFSVRHILVGLKSERNPAGHPEEEAKALLGKVQEALKAGRKLEELAKEFSDDPGSKDKGGLYEDIAFGQFVPEFEAAVKAQELGKPGEPVRSNFGFHIIQVEKRDLPTQETFEAAQEKVRQVASQARQEQVWVEYITRLKGEIPYQVGKSLPDTASAPAKPAKGTKGAQAPKGVRTAKGGAQ